MKKVLVVEDDYFKIETFKKKLSKFEVTFAKGFTSAIKEITSNKFDIVFLDFDLGEGSQRSGLQIADKVKDSPNANSQFYIHSSSLVGRNLMIDMLTNLQCKAEVLTFEDIKYLTPERLEKTL